MANLSPETETKLRAAIAEHGLQSVGELIISSSVECAVLLVGTPEDYQTVGTSRYGGVPDLPDESLWPRTKSGAFYSFYMQINLADVPDFAGNLLPRRGMLYCFLADFDDGAIVWADVKPSSLKRAGEKDADELSGWDDGSDLKPHRLEIRTALNPPGWYSGPYGKIEEALSEQDKDAAEGYDDFARDVLYGQDSQRYAGRLLGQPAYIGYDPDEDDETPPTDTLLWMLDTNRLVDVSYGDAGYMQIFIERDALEKHDFSNVVTRMESS